MHTMQELTLTQLQAITLGALEIRQTEDGFRFFRMTDGQRDAFARANASFASKCLAGRYPHPDAQRR